MTVLYELRTSKVRQSQSPILVTREQLYESAGFRSVYGFSEEVVEFIRETGRTANLKYHRMYSDELLLDFDDKPEQADQAEQWFLKNCHTYQRYQSGGRSVHFHAPITPMHAIGVPYSQLAFVKANFPGADQSIYRSSGMYRLELTFHESGNGQQKRFERGYYGGVDLTIPLIKAALPSAPVGLEDESQSEIQEYLLTRDLMTAVSEGENRGRNNHVFSMARACALTGKSYEEALDLISGWNAHSARPPLPQNELETAVRSGFDKRRR